MDHEEAKFWEVSICFETKPFTVDACLKKGGSIGFQEKNGPFQTSTARRIELENGCERGCQGGWSAELIEKDPSCTTLKYGIRLRFIVNRFG